MTQRLVEIVWPDFQMDTKGDFGLPVNALPIKCTYCGFPDLDSVAQPYFLAKGVRSSKEIDVAELGNFFVVERVRRVLEIVVPEECDFFPTLDLKTKEHTCWYLAVPRHQICTGGAKSEIPRCPKCGEAKTAHWGSQCEYAEEPQVDHDIVKTSNWVSGEQIGEAARWYLMHVLKVKGKQEFPAHQWTRVTIHRFLYFSVRLDALLKKLRVKGLVSCAFRKPKTNTSDYKLNDLDQAWVAEKLAALAILGLTEPTQINDSMTWLRNHLAKHGKAKKTPVDFGPTEAKASISLPDSYKEFVSRAKKMKFKNIDDQEGFDVEVLLPEKLRVEDYRKGRVQSHEASMDVDGVMFAVTGHGDCFCFNLAENAPDYSIYLYNHELDSFDRYASNFAECIRRWVDR